MEIFVPLIIFWVISSVIKGLQREQQSSRGGPLARPQPRREEQPARAEEPAPERPVRVRREPSRPVEAPAPVVQPTARKEYQPTARKEYQPKEQRLPRQSRLMKEGEQSRPTSRLQEETQKSIDLIAQQELQVVMASPVAGSVKAPVPDRSNPLARIKQDLNRPEAIAAAIVYGEILGAPRARKPHQTPLQGR